MGRGSSKVGSGGGGGAIPRDVQSAIQQRTEKANESDLNDGYTFAMDQLYNGYHANGTPVTTPAEEIVNGMAGNSAWEFSKSEFVDFINDQASQYGVTDVVKELGNAVVSFNSLANTAIDSGEKAFYKDMVTFTKFTIQKYKG